MTIEQSGSAASSSDAHCSSLHERRRCTNPAAQHRTDRIWSTDATSDRSASHTAAMERIGASCYVPNAGWLHQCDLGSIDRVGVSVFS
jgi:hypothetical protein